MKVAHRWVGVVVACAIGCGDSGAGTNTDGASGASAASTGEHTQSPPTGSDPTRDDDSATAGVPTDTAVDGSNSATDSATSDGPTTGTMPNTHGQFTLSDTGTGTDPDTDPGLPDTSTGPGDPDTTNGPGDPDTTDTPNDTGPGGDDGTSTGVVDPDTTDGGDDTSTGGDDTGGVVPFCDGQGGILVPGPEQTCTGDLAEKTFVFALCSCSKLTTTGVFMTDSFNSNDPDQPVQNGGSVGVNGSYTTNVLADIGGALWIDGDMSTLAVHDVAQDLQCGGNISTTLLSHVGGDAYVEGNIGGLLPLMTIDGDLHIPANKVSNGATVLGQKIKEPVQVKTPCDCSDPIDIAGIVQGYKADNDNDEAMVPVTRLENILAESVELDCGRYFFTEAQSLLSLELVLTGRTVIAIEGDFNNLGLFNLELGPDAELDLFVSGDMTFVDLAQIGDIARPANLRIYVGGQVTFASGFQLGGNLYMPNSVFNAAGLASVYGSLFVGGIQIVELFSIHYDAAILEIEGCEEPGGSCGDCHDCLNPTPKCGPGGECVACQTDADCCPPHRCNDDGTCGPTPG